jgi:drug/metabolite transporter (DMT)-like permease
VIAIAGIALLLVNEARAAPLGGSVGWGIWLSLGAMLAASISNVIQAGQTGRQVPLITLIAWSMLYGDADRCRARRGRSRPAGAAARPAYWLGTAYLAIAGSVVTFPLYYGLIREIGAGRAAYHNVLVVIVAMLLSTLLEGYRWSALAVAGSALALLGLVIALRAKSL